MLYVTKPVGRFSGSVPKLLFSAHVVYKTNAFLMISIFLQYGPSGNHFLHVKKNINKTNAFLILLLRLDENTVKPMVFACLLWLKKIVRVSLHNVS